MKKKTNNDTKNLFVEVNFAAFVAFLILFAIIAAPFLSRLVSPNEPNPSSQTPSVQIPARKNKSAGNIQKFSSEEDFKEYLSESQASNYGFGGYARNISAKTIEMGEIAVDSSIAPAPQSAKSDPSTYSGRVSETNVQVAGIDEPDIIKTDGNEIYYSSQSNYLYKLRELPLWDSRMPYQEKNETKIIGAFPPENLKIDGIIPENGELLLDNNILAVFSSNKITGYDVSSPASPQEKWKIDLNDNAQISASRLFNGKIYLITNNYINYSKPCPIDIMSANGSPVSIVCADIYRPSIPTEIDNTYTISIINPQNGTVENNISFVGSGSNSIIYMSPNAIYASYYYNGDYINFYANFFTERCSDIISSNIVTRLKKLSTYDIGQQAKYVELQNILSQINPSDADDRIKFESEFENRLKEYLSEHGRELENTGIFKISSSDLSILSQGSIPGALLNQFSLDEFENHLRVATTIGVRRGSMYPPSQIFGMGSSESVNDAYVLDDNLNIAGKVLDMGKGEKIYSARFIGDKGYIVTFRQTDPFYVLDLSDPNNPQLKGELKIPGYSSYLHPIDENRILGIGKEDNKIKISLFDVSSAENPTEISKYTLDEYWSDILNTHHAFLLDSNHQIFFLPGTKGSYIFSYKNGELKLAKAISAISAQRALYINDYLYVVGQDKITVLNEENWEKISELEL